MTSFDEKTTAGFVAQVGREHEEMMTAFNRVNARHREMLDTFVTVNRDHTEMLQAFRNVHEQHEAMNRNLDEIVSLLRKTLER